jgi:tetratricopeptide (TPR) repeat protein
MLSARSRSLSVAVLAMAAVADVRIPASADAPPATPSYDPASNSALLRLRRELSAFRTAQGRLSGSSPGAYEAARRFVPRDPVAFAMLAAEITEAAHRHPDAGALHALGVLRLAERRYDGAREAFARSVVLAPLVPEVLNDAAVAYLAPDQASATLADAVRALDLALQATRLRSFPEAAETLRLARQRSGLEGPPPGIDPPCAGDPGEWARSAALRERILTALESETPGAAPVPGLRDDAAALDGMTGGGFWRSLVSEPRAAEVTAAWKSARTAHREERYRDAARALTRALSHGAAASTATGALLRLTRAGDSYFVSDFASAEADLAQVRTHADPRGWPYHRAAGLGAVLAWQRGDLAAAHVSCHQAIPGLCNARDAPWLANMYYGLAEIARNAGLFEDAWRYQDQASSVPSVGADRARLLWHGARLALAEGRGAAALAFAEALTALGHATADVVATASGASLMLEAGGSPESAVEGVEARLSDPELRRRLEFERAVARARHAEARHSIQLLAPFVSAGDIAAEHRINAHRVVALAHRRLGETQDAERHLREAFRLAGSARRLPDVDALSALDTVERIAADLLDVLIDQARWDDALQVAEQVRFNRSGGWSDHGVDTACAGTPHATVIYLEGTTELAVVAIGADGRLARRVPAAPGDVRRAAEGLVPATSPQARAQALEDLYRLLIAPVKRPISGHSRLRIVPSASPGLVPFAALRGPKAISTSGAAKSATPAAIGMQSISR